MIKQQIEDWNGMQSSFLMSFQQNELSTVYCQGRMQIFQAKQLLLRILFLVGYATVKNQSRDCLNSQCSMKKRSLKVHLLLMPFPNTLCIYFSMQISITKDDSQDLPEYQVQLSVCFSTDCHQHWFNLFW